jgi:hypothetical protein
LAADCEQEGFNIYLANGSSFEGVYIVSQTLGTWSSTIPPLKDEFQIVDGGLSWQGGAGAPATFEEATCTQAQLVLGELATKDRAPEAIATVLEALVEDGGVWIGLPYP